MLFWSEKFPIKMKLKQKKQQTEWKQESNYAIHFLHSVSLVVSASYGSPQEERNVEKDEDKS